MSNPENARLPADTRLGNYRIARCIGEGGMGTVYEGIHEGLGKRVAIKTLHAASGPQRQQLLERFVREGKAVAKIQHPNVVDVFDVSVHEGSPYLVMEFLEGQDLGARMEQEAPMAPQSIADLLIPVCSALAAAHEAGIIHRDLKPDNIFVTVSKGGILEPKLVDFGISKLADVEGHLTATNAMLGTPYYMSPEQAGSAKHVDHRSDIFSLGVIMYQCATHELPFKGDSLYQLLGAILHAEPPAPRSLVGGLPPEFEAVIARAMKKDPAERFQSATEIGAALLPFATTRIRLLYEPEFAHAQSIAQPAPPARSRAGWWAWAAVLLCAILGAALWLSQRTRIASPRAERVAPQSSAPSPAAQATTTVQAEPKPEPEVAPIPPSAPVPAQTAIAEVRADAPASASTTGAAAANRKPKKRANAASNANESVAKPAATAPAATTAPEPAPSAPPPTSREDLLNDRK
jgi:hypothetical protein